jgi:hypothetical protein
MTVYLWHLPVLILLAGLSLVANVMFGLPLPEPLSLEWWASRPLWLSVAAGVVLPVALVFGRFERAARGDGGRGRGRGTPARGIRGPRRSLSATAPRTASVTAIAATTAIDAVCGVAGVAVLLVFGFAPLPAAVALLLLVMALRGSASVGRQRRSRRMGTAIATHTATAA